MNQQSKAYLFALSAVMLWSTVATAFKIALQYVDFMQLLLISSGVASIVMAVILTVEGKLKAAFSLSKSEFMAAAFRGVLNPFLYYIILFKAYDLLPAQEALTLNYTWPITLTLLSVPLLKQKLSRIGMVAVLLSFIGVILIASKGNLGQLQLTNLFGDTLAVFTSVIWALFWIVNIRSKVDESIKLFYSFLFGFIFTIPIVALFSSFDLPSIEGWAASVYVGVAEMGLAFFLWLKALKYSKRTDQVSQLIFLSPFISLLFIALILHESIHIATLIGLFFILAGIFLNTWYQKKQAKKNLFHLVREGEKGSK